ncbi:MAG: hypothetical protein ABSG53_25680, partial [Thermoguttaceae bacterium]
SPGYNYTSVNSSVVISAYSSTAWVAVPTADNPVYETNGEYFMVDVTGATGACVPAGTSASAFLSNELFWGGSNNGNFSNGPWHVGSVTGPNVGSWQAGYNAEFPPTTVAETINLTGSASVDTLHFLSSGYTLTGGTITVGAAGLTVDVASGDTAAINSAITGSYSLTEVDTGALSLGGTDSVGGGVTVNPGSVMYVTGTLVVGGSLNGDVVDNGGITFDGTSSQSVIGNISGSGTVTVDCSGSLSLAGCNTYTGVTTVTAGTLNLQSPLSGSLSVASGATVTGPYSPLEATIAQTSSGPSGPWPQTNSQLSYSASVSDSANSQMPGLKYAWSATLGGTTLFTGINSTFSFTPTSAGVYTVSLSVTDNDAAGQAAPVSVAVGTAIPAAAVGDNPPDVSAADVEYANGAAVLSADDLGLGAPTRSYSSAMSGTNCGLGFGWTLADDPFVQQLNGGSQYMVVFGPLQSYQFNYSGGTYTGTNGILETLADNAGVFTLTMPDGTVYQFNDFSSNNPNNGANHGAFLGMYAPTGNQVVASYYSNSGSEIASIAYSVGGSSTPCQTKQFVWSNGAISSVTLLDDTGSKVRQAVYAYYGSGNSYGPQGELESATEQFSSNNGHTWTAGGSYYYRYETDGLLTLAMTPQDVANAGGLAAVMAVTDSTLDPYSALQFQYSQVAEPEVSPSPYLVTGVIVGGLQSAQYTYSYYFNNSGDFGYNIWQTGTLETRPDGTHESVFTNFLGETLLSDLADSGYANHWVSYNQYGAMSGNQAMLTLAASPSAVNLSHENSTADPLTGQYDEGYDWTQNNLGVSLYASAGELDEYDYASATTAVVSSGTTDAAPGNVAGYLQAEYLANGTAAVPVLQGSYQYYAHTGNFSTGAGSVSVTVYPEANSTVYRNTDGTWAIETSYSNTWYSGTVQPSETITYLPVVTTAQNGPGTQWTVKDVFDNHGNLVWQEDANCRFIYYAYAAVTGLTSEEIDDATTNPGSISPPGTLPSTGVNATSYFYYDTLGRPTQTVAPQFVDSSGDTVCTVTWTEYLDSPVTLGSGVGEGGTGAEVVSASGFQVVTPGNNSNYTSNEYVLVNPIDVTVSNLDGQVTDQIQADDTTAVSLPNTTLSAVSSGIFTASTPSDPWSRWTHNDYVSQA